MQSCSLARPYYNCCYTRTVRSGVVMPVYEFRCQNCHNRVGIQLSYAEYGVKAVTCPVCGSHKLTRLIGRVRIAKSEDRRMDDLSDPSFMGDVDENDPRSLARATKKWG